MPPQIFFHLVRTKTNPITNEDYPLMEDRPRTFNLPFLRYSFSKNIWDLCPLKILGPIISLWNFNFTVLSLIAAFTFQVDPVKTSSIFFAQKIEELALSQQLGPDVQKWRLPDCW